VLDITKIPTAAAAATISVFVLADSGIYRANRSEISLLKSKPISPQLEDHAAFPRPKAQLKAAPTHFSDLDLPSDGCLVPGIDAVY
jgi:hypothetical protein